MAKGDERTELVARIAERARRSRKTVPAAAAESFVRAYFARVPLADIRDQDVADLAGQALSFLAFARARAPGRAAVRVFNPDRATHGWAGGRTVVEVVNDNMPFLVDSITMALNAHARGAHIVIHPIVKAWRDKDGVLAALGSADRPHTDWRELTESFIHIETERQAVGRELAEIRRAVEATLTDVRRAVRDWTAMRGQLADIIGGLGAVPVSSDNDGPDASQDVGEVYDFLKWLDDDHFTFLGYRRYDFVAHKERIHAEGVARSGLGILRDASMRVFYADESGLQRDMRRLLAKGDIVSVTKANRRATVHRPSHMDTVGIRILDARGNTVGEHRFVGLFTSHAYSLSPRFVPLLRRKIARCMRKAGFDAASHDGKALLHILEGYPRDELFQISEDELLETSLGILQLQERQRTALFARRDPFGRFASCLVFTPKEVYSSGLRERFGEILSCAFAGTVSAFYPQIGDDPLARIHFIIRTDPAHPVEPHLAEVEGALAAAARSWADELRDSLIAARGERAGLALLERYRHAFPVAYSDTFPAAHAIGDVDRIEQALADDGAGLSLYRRDGAAPHELRLKIYHSGRPLPLSDALPVLENMGLRVIEEIPFRIEPHGAPPVWIHDFGVECRCGHPAETSDDFERIRALFEDALMRIRAGELENDGYNQLVLAEGLGWRDVTVVRTYSRYLRQAGVPFSQEYMIDTFANNRGFARMLVALFRAKFDPADRAGANARIATLKVDYEEALDKVANLDEDRILRRFLNLVLASQRTNHYQTSADGTPKPCLAIKLASGEIDDLPAPRPWREVWVYSPRLEAIHLRGGPVARGGIRWSDRREDFRTEILGLMKTQTIKNPVIVPVGAKGGFVVKRPPADGGRPALQAEGVECYRAFMRGLLDITDNRSGNRVIPPKDVVRHDGDDPYLVVAADKGTATFSDIANGISRDEYGFWLDDAFASGGSAGYDHKEMGITARGAWESVKRHFREMGKDVQAEDFTCVGVGDMAGDVFGNGMLRSPHTKLLAAFNHVHIFLDPDPDPAVSIKERRRLFDTPRSTWMDYDRSLISKGGGVHERSAKSIPITPEVKAMLGISASALPPDELIHRILTADVELLWFGGIGTFVKSSAQSHADVGDRANDALRVDASDLRCKVIGEGANLAMTQLGRIEYAQAGGRLNTDSIDNSAGVDTSDHEVNIKILLGQAVQAKKLPMKARDKLLADMTEEVAALVLRDNYLQTQALSVAQSEAAERIAHAQRLIRALERTGRISRKLDSLPSDEALAERARDGAGLTRPELAVLLAHSKLAINDELIETDLPDQATFGKDLVDYFPTPLRKRFAADISRHRLRREIVVTAMANQIVNRTGPTFVNDMKERTGRDAGAVARAFEIVRQAFDCDRLWREIEALDNRVPAACQIDMLREIARLVEHAVVWFLENGEHPLAIEGNVATFRPCIAALARVLPDVTSEEAGAALQGRRASLADAAVPEALARIIAGLPLMNVALDVVRLAGSDHRTIPDMAKVYFDIGARFGFDWLRAAARRLEAQTHWQRQAVQSMVDELYALQHQLVAGVIEAAGNAKTVEAIVPLWEDKRKALVTRTRQTIADIQASSATDLAMIAVALRQLRVLVTG